MVDRETLRRILQDPLSQRVASDGDEVAVGSALHLWVVLARAYGAVGERDQRSLDRFGLTRAEYSVLDALHFKGPMALGELKGKLLVSSGGMTYLVDRLEKRGFVARRPSPSDRRSVFVELTDEGRRFFRTLFGDHVLGLAETLSALDLDEQRLLADLLKKLGLGAAARTARDP